MPETIVKDLQKLKTKLDEITTRSVSEIIVALAMHECLEKKSGPCARNIDCPFAFHATSASLWLVARAASRKKMLLPLFGMSNPCVQIGALLNIRIDISETFESLPTAIVDGNRKHGIRTVGPNRLKQRRVVRTIEATYVYGEKQLQYPRALLPEKLQKCLKAVMDLDNAYNSETIDNGKNDDEGKEKKNKKDKKDKDKEKKGDKEKKEDKEKKYKKKDNGKKEKDKDKACIYMLIRCKLILWHVSCFSYNCVLLRIYSSPLQASKSKK